AERDAHVGRQPADAFGTGDHGQPAAERVRVSVNTDRRRRGGGILIVRRLATAGAECYIDFRIRKGISRRRPHSSANRLRSTRTGARSRTGVGSRSIARWDRCSVCRYRPGKRPRIIRKQLITEADETVTRKGKSEIRNPKSETNSKSKKENPKGARAA